MHIAAPLKFAKALLISAFQRCRIAAPTTHRCTASTPSAHWIATAANRSYAWDDTLITTTKKLMHNMHRRPKKKQK